MEIAIVQRHERSCVVRSMAIRIIWLETNGMVKAKLQARLGNAEFLFGFGTARKDADDGCLLGGVGLPLLDFEVDGASGPGLDPFGAPLHEGSRSEQLPLPRRDPARDFRGFAAGRRVAIGDLLLEPKAQSLRMERAAIEEDGVHPRPVAKKVRQITGNCAVCGIGERPLPETCLRAHRAIVRLHTGKKPSSAIDSISARLICAVSVLPSKLDPWEGTDTEKSSPAEPDEAAFLQIPASRDKEVPLGGGKRLGCETRLNVVRDGQIDIVASEQQVVAHGDALDMAEGRPTLASDLEETEIGSPSADVDDERVTGAGFGKFQRI